MFSHSKARGFTIVELLVVIVVIAILAAVSIVAYNGIQLRAKKTATNAAVAQASRQIALFVAEKGNPPTGLAEAGVTTPSSGVDFTYTADGTTWCITGANGNVSYMAGSNASSPKEGDCIYSSTVATLTSRGIMTGVKTIVFVGTMPASWPHYVFDFRLAGNCCLYKASSGTTLSAMNYTGTWATYRLDSDKMVAYALNPPGDVYVGQRYSQTEFWPGSWKAMGFSDVLTNAQIEQVITKLKTEI